MMRRLLALLLVSLSLPALADEFSLPVSFSRFQHAEDLGDAAIVDGHLKIIILSSRGIGRCHITPDANTWPRTVEIFFPGLTEIEELRLKTKRLSSTGSRKQSGRFAFEFIDATVDAKKDPPQAVPTPPAGTLDIQVTKDAGGIVVKLPAKLLAGKETLELAWVDWFRG
ncbi:MAG: hypothetical protein C0478_15360 [Planctomyces sp.]|nr:hypothetical protein [Planctomyces sp.]